MKWLQKGATYEYTARYVLSELAGNRSIPDRLIRETHMSYEHAIRRSIIERSETMGLTFSQSVAKDDQDERVIYISFVDLRGSQP